MNQCVPSWDLDKNSKLNFRSHSNSLPLTPPDVPTLDYEVAELTWENGQLSMHGLGHPRVPTKSQPTTSNTKYTWDKPSAGGTLESIVDQATFFPHYKSTEDGGCGGGDVNASELVPKLNHHQRSNAAPPSTTATASTTVVMDALVPCTLNSNRNVGGSAHVLDSGIGTRAESCSGVATFVARAAMAHEWSSCRDQSVTGSATFCRDSRQATLDTCEKEFGVGGFTSASLGSPGNTSSGKQCTGDDHDSVCHSRPQREVGHEETKKKANQSSVSTKRSRAAAVHNQSERKRRDKINQRMKTLQKLVPNSSKTDKASMLDEVIEYLKQLQAQVNLMSRMNLSPMMLPLAMQQQLSSPMMLPLAMQQQLQMSMMAPMMGMGMGMGSMGMGVMDMNAAMAAGRPNITGISPVLHPSAFMSPLTSWEGAGDRLHTPASLMPDPMSTFLAACQSQPMTMDAYSRMAALFQQLHQNSAPSAKNL